VSIHISEWGACASYAYVDFSTVLQNYQQPNVHEHSQRATKGAVERARLLALLRGFCGLRLLRAAELSRGCQQDDRELTQRHRKGCSEVSGEEGKENAPSSHGSYAPCGVFVMASRPWARAQTTRTHKMLAIIILHTLGVPSGHQLTLTSRCLGSNFFCAASSS
jgi:hypothetical protein